MTLKPTFLFTFAQNGFKGVKTETNFIWKAANKHPHFKAKKLTDVNIEKLAQTILTIGKDLWMFHFGGHADSSGIVLDGFRNLDKTRLANLLLRKEHPLQFVFLNGCLSYGHVGILTARGVKAIIATNVRVDDAEATRLAHFFYQAFLQKDYTLKEAFEFAEATVLGQNSYPIIVNPGDVDNPMPASWTLFIHANHNEVLNWKLMDFIQAAQPKPNSPVPSLIQNHSGTGDNVAGNKMSVQVNQDAYEKNILKNSAVKVGGDFQIGDIVNNYYRNDKT